MPRETEDPFDPFDPDLPMPSRDDEDDEPTRRRAQTNILHGSSAAGARALGVQVVSFYFRAPVKAFFRTRIDYMAVARAIHPSFQANERWSFRLSTPALIAHAVRTQGWGFLHRQILPPMIANASVGAVLYSSYLQTLSMIHEPSSHKSKRTWPPPEFSDCFKAGMIAGSITSLVAAPLDALVVRFNVSDMLEGNYKSMIEYGKYKLHEIGVRGVFAGYGLSLIKESLGYGLFFGSFEYVKSQAYYSFLRWYYGDRVGHHVMPGPVLSSQSVPAQHKPTIRPHYAIEPAFLLLAGASASILQQAVHHPMTKIQDVHYGRLESIDYATKITTGKISTLEMYRHSYEQTINQCKMQAKKAGGWRKWCYKGFVMNTLRQIPSTSAGLIVFELVRRKFGETPEERDVGKGEMGILIS